MAREFVLKQVESSHYVALGTQYFMWQVQRKIGQEDLREFPKQEPGRDNVHASEVAQLPHSIGHSIASLCSPDRHHKHCAVSVQRSGLCRRMDPYVVDLGSPQACVVVGKG